MNNKLEVIGIDHGWSMMKTISQVFVTGVKEITTTPALFGDVLEYEGKFYKVGTVRQEVKDTKVEDDSFYLLTLATVAKELKRRGLEEAKVFLVENGKRGKATWLYIDEFHVLLNSEYSAKYLQQLWKKVRKQGGLCTGITQNVIDLLQNYTATTMLANSEFVALLKQANTDSSKMAEVIGVSEAQLRFVTNTASGMGLIKCGSVVIPFDNQISKDTDLYKLYNTNIHEIIEMKKHANEKC